MTTILSGGGHWLCARDTTFYQPPDYVSGPLQSSQDQLLLAAILFGLAIGLAVVAVTQIHSGR